MHCAVKCTRSMGTGLPLRSRSSSPTATTWSHGVASERRTSDASPMVVSGLAAPCTTPTAKLTANGTARKMAPWRARFHPETLFPRVSAAPDKGEKREGKKTRQRLAICANCKGANRLAPGHLDALQGGLAKRSTTCLRARLSEPHPRSSTGHPHPSPQLGSLALTASGHWAPGQHMLLTIVGDLKARKRMERMARRGDLRFCDPPQRHTCRAVSSCLPSTHTAQVSALSDRTKDIDVRLAPLPKEPLACRSPEDIPAIPECTSRAP